MAGFKARGSIVQFKWQETPEGREFLGGILHRNRRKSFGLLETPSLPPQLSVETASFKIVLTGKPGVGKTSTVAKLLGQEVPKFHIETPGIQTSVVYWPVKLKDSQKVVMFKFQFWDCGENAIRKYDHLLPALKDKADAALFLFSFTDSICDLTFIKLDQILNSDFTEQEMREFEQQWRVPVLRIANVTGRRLADGRGLDGRADITDVAPFLNSLAELLWQRDHVTVGAAAKGVSRHSSAGSRSSEEFKIYV
ncbi:Ciliogenesis and planar polarity effector 2 [Acropora cervicornis]|uniref:Ciliogenesis and planar polarity effector 2 n=1 Tax=Acropora cervicornis TaxID=6130 RepID=A0AAD9V1H2_ACRCE|nr:Ciliogenesis and planar polarity effector 2 [Acropora cervicornis]